jgi:AcrR family transcriptional regulator
MKTAPRSYRQTARADSAEATGRRIIDAFLARLMQQWFDEITLDAIAEDAGVTVQTVVRRFGGKEGLLGSAVESLGAQINAQRAAPPGDLDRLVQNLIGDYEKTGDAVIRLLALEPRQAALKSVLDFGRGEHQRWVASVFAEVLDGVEPADRQLTLDALLTATDVYAWKLLRRDMGRSARATAATLKNLIQAIINNSQNTKYGIKSTDKISQ